MQNYNYEDFSEKSIENRFSKPDNLDEEDPFKGESIWNKYMSEFNFPEQSSGKDLENNKSILINVLSELRSELFSVLPNNLDCPRLFISHKMDDKDYSLRIAHLASKAGFSYWIDVLDPALKKAPVIKINDPILNSIYTACIIEMALINCTHVIACMTPITKRSQWVPYEYGRITEIPKNFERAAAWIHPELTEIPEYHNIGLIHANEKDINEWLKKQKEEFKKCNNLNPKVDFNDTKPLPTS